MHTLDLVSANLPETVSAALREALNRIPGGGRARILGPDNEGALNHVLFIETSAGRSVFRMRREASYDEIFQYLNSMYIHTGFPEIGGIFRLRSIREEIAFLRYSHALSLPVPQLQWDGGNWMLIEFIEGQTAYAAVKKGDLSVVGKVLETLYHAHTQGVIYGDRWGDNEVIDPQGRVRTIDFDVEWTLDEQNTGFLEAMEMSVYLFNALRLTSDRPALLDLVKLDLAPRLRSWGYDMERMAEVVSGLGRFYLDPNKQGNQWSLPASLYLTLPEPLNGLVSHLSS